MRRILSVLLTMVMMLSFFAGVSIPTNAAQAPAYVAEPEVGTAYKLGMNIGGTVYYFTGNTDNASFRLATSTNAADAVNVKLEAADGGYRLFFEKSGVKTYIRVYHRQDGDPGYGKGSLELVTTAPSEVLTYDETANTLVYDYDGNNAYYMGTFGSYTNISVSNTSYITGNNAGNVDKSQYPVRFYAASQSAEPEVTEPVATQPQPGEPSGNAGVVENPVAGTAYKLGMDKGDGKVLYFTGNPESESVSYRLETSENVAAAVDVYLEAANGGYRLYFMNGGVKTYIRVFHRVDGDPGYGKGSVEFVTSAPSEVFTYNEEANTLFYDYDGNNAYYMGTYGSYTTVSISNTSYITGDKASSVDVSQFPVRFYTVEEGGQEPEVTEPVATQPQPGEPSGNAGVVENPVAGTAYKLGMDKGDGKVLYFTGNPESESVSYRLETSENVAAAVDVYLEAANGGYRLYFMNGGVKTYIRVFHRVDGDPGYGKGSVEFVTSAPSEVYTYDRTANTLIYDYDGNNAYYMGTYGSYTTVSVSNTSYITGDKASSVDVSQFPVRFYTVEEGGQEPEVTEPVATQPQPGEPSGNAGVVENPVAGTAYKLGMDKGDGKVLYFTGNPESESVSYRLETSENVAAAVDVYLEAANGGYRLYFMNGGVKTYIRVFHRVDGDPGYGKGSVEFVTSAPSEVYTYDRTANTLIYDYDGNNAYYMGTYGSYTTVSVSNTSYITGNNAGNVDVSQFPVRFYTVEEGGQEPEVTEPEVTEPEVTEPGSEPAYMLVSFIDLDTNLALAALDETYTYGYMPATGVTITENNVEGLTDQNIFAVLDAGDDEHVYIVDCYGRFVFMKGTYNSFNVSAEIPAEGGLWTFDFVDDYHFTITNATTGKTIGFDSDFNNYGAYADASLASQFVVVLWETEEPGIPGDLTGDGTVDNLDVEYLLWYTLFPEDYPLTGVGDFDGNGTVDNLDVEYLLWHTLFPEDYPLIQAPA